jgi:ribose 1,5-bisphosphokinase
VWLTAETDVLAGRLASRGREGPEQIRARLARNRRLPHPHDSDCLVIDNSGALEDAGNQLLQVLGD